MKLETQKLVRSCCLLLSIVCATVCVYAADLTTSPIPAPRECGEQLALMNLQKAPPSPRTALRQARAQNYVAGKEVVKINPLIVKAGLHVEKNTCCCSWLAGCCVVLCWGCCYEPSEGDLYSARRKLEREENEKKAKDSTSTEK